MNLNIILARLPNLVLFVALFALSSLSGCTSLPKLGEATTSGAASKGKSHLDKEAPADSVSEAAPDQHKDADQIKNTALELALDPNLPNQDLSQELLEQLLILNLASYQGDWSQASKSAIKSAQQSQDYRVARVATLLALRNNDYAMAVGGAELWLTLNPDADDALNMLLISQVGNGQIDEALASLAQHRRKLEGQDNELDRHIKQTAGLLVRQRNDKAALKIAEHYVEAYPTSAQVALSAAYVAETFKEMDVAEEWVNQALALRPGWDLAAQMKANMLRSQGKVAEREQFIARFVEAYPESTMMRINHAAELARNKDYEAAFEVMQNVLASVPDDVSALSYAGALAQQLEKTELAKKYYRRALAQDPKNDDVRWSLARIAVVEEKYAIAEQLYGDINSPESYVGAQIQVANMRYHTQGLKYAINTLRALEPETEAQYIEIALTRHYLLMQDLEYEEAFGYINETLLYLPTNIDLVYARALVASELRKIDIAESDFKMILATQPKHANALNALGYTLADQTTRYEEAKEYITQALELRPDDAHILDSMGWVAYRMKDFATAIEFLERAFAASPEVEIAAHLGEVLWEAGQQEKANEIWQQSFADDADNADNPTLKKTLERYGVDPKARAKNRAR